MRKLGPMSEEKGHHPKKPLKAWVLMEFMNLTPQTVAKEASVAVSVRKFSLPRACGFLPASL